MPQIRRVEEFNSREEAEEKGRLFFDQWGYGYEPRYYVEHIDDKFIVTFTHWDTCD